MLSLRASSTQTLSLLFLYSLYSSFFFWCLVQSGLFLFLKLAFLCYSSTALAGGYSCVTLTPYPFRLCILIFMLLSEPSRKSRPNILAAAFPHLQPFAEETFFLSVYTFF